MGVFGFIENFFFVSLGILFVLVLLLVYHFKKRMAVAEKKSESMYGLLSTLVKEIKNIRSTFGSGSAGAKPTAAPAEQPNLASSPSGNKSKTEPEISVSIKNLPSPEIITLDLAATEIPVSVAGASKKIVVSDDSDSETEEYDSDDSDFESEDDFEGVVIEKTQHSAKQDDDTSSESIQEDGYNSESDTESDVENIVLDLTPLKVQTSVEEVVLSQAVEVLPPASESKVESVSLDDLALPSTPSIGTDSVTEKPSSDHLRKMNINQLRTIAIQRGITADTSKMKKNELIHLIQTK